MKSTPIAVYYKTMNRESVPPDRYDDQHSIFNTTPIANVSWPMHPPYFQCFFHLTSLYGWFVSCYTNATCMQILSPAVHISPPQSQVQVSRPPAVHIWPQEVHINRHHQHCLLQVSVHLPLPQLLATLLCVAKVWRYQLPAIYIYIYIYIYR